MQKVSMQYEDTNQTVTDTDISEFEHAMQIDLPESFRRHYLAHNGGYPVDVEEVSGRDYVFPFHGFFPLKYGALTIEVVKKDLAEDFGLSNAIPFAYDQGSNIFYISTEPSDFGSVFQITADTKEKFFVCDTFDQFLDGLRSV
jgi:cell wall assembly regulator SMI1